MSAVTKVLSIDSPKTPKSLLINTDGPKSPSKYAKKATFDNLPDFDFLDEEGELEEEGNITKSNKEGLNGSDKEVNSPVRKSPSSGGSNGPPTPLNKAADSMVLSKLSSRDSLSGGSSKSSRLKRQQQQQEPRRFQNGALNMNLVERRFSKVLMKTVFEREKQEKFEDKLDDMRDFIAAKEAEEELDEEIRYQVRETKRELDEIERFMDLEIRNAELEGISGYEISRNSGTVKLTGSAWEGTGLGRGKGPVNLLGFAPQKEMEEKEALANMAATSSAGRTPTITVTSIVAPEEGGSPGGSPNRLTLPAIPGAEPSPTTPVNSPVTPSRLTFAEKPTVKNINTNTSDGENNVSDNDNIVPVLSPRASANLQALKISQKIQRRNAKAARRQQRRKLRKALNLTGGGTTNRLNAGPKTLLYNPDDKVSMKAHLKEVAEFFGKEQVEDLREVFDFFDDDKSGGIGENELIQLMGILGRTISPAEAKLLFEKIDLDKSGSIDFQEFICFFADKVKTLGLTDDQNSFSELEAVFKLLDRDGNGSVSAVELKAVLASMGESVSREEVEDMIKMVQEVGRESASTWSSSGSKSRGLGGLGPGGKGNLMEGGYSKVDLAASLKLGSGSNSHRKRGSVPASQGISPKTDLATPKSGRKTMGVDFVSGGGSPTSTSATTSTAAAGEAGLNQNQDSVGKTQSQPRSTTVGVFGSGRATLGSITTSIPLHEQSNIHDEDNVEITAKCFMAFLRESGFLSQTGKANMGASSEQLSREFEKGIRKLARKSEKLEKRKTLFRKTEMAAQARKTEMLNLNKDKDKEGKLVFPKTPAGGGGPGESQAKGGINFNLGNELTVPSGPGGKNHLTLPANINGGPHNGLISNLCGYTNYNEEEEEEDISSSSESESSCGLDGGSDSDGSGWGSDGD